MLIFYYLMHIIIKTTLLFYSLSSAKVIQNINVGFEFDMKNSNSTVTALEAAFYPSN